MAAFEVVVDIAERGAIAHVDEAAQRTLRMASTSRSRLTPEQRKALAQNLRRRASKQKSLTPEQRKEARRLASNLEKIPDRFRPE